MSCHEADGAVAVVEEGRAVIALVGSPNAGKTTLFNALCGVRAKTANYPGVTVSRREAATTLADGSDATRNAARPQANDIARNIGISSAVP